MAILDRLLGRTAAQETALALDTSTPARVVLPDPYEPFDGQVFGSSGIAVADPGVPLLALQRRDVEAVWSSQPNVRKVVDFVARNVASIPLRLFERVSDTDRQRVTGHVLNDALGAPQRGVSPYTFWRGVLTDGLLYDRWAVIKVPTESGLDLVQVPSWRLALHVDALRRVTSAAMWVGDGPAAEGDVNGYRPLPLDSLVFDHGYAPSSAGLSPIETLSDVLAETAASVEWRRQVWANGGRASAWIGRPAEAPAWEAAQRARFQTAFRAGYRRGGTDVGGVPLLEDGMSLHPLETFNSKDTLDLDGRRLTAEETAGFWHIAPELLGIRPGNYSNVREYRQTLYRDSLGPYITAWEGAINAQLVPDLAAGRPLYVEAHVDAKLRGSFEEQASVKQAAVGGPWITVNESRALENRPPVEGGDVVARPLNLLYGSSTTTPGPTGTGRASAAPSSAGGTKERRGRVRVKGRPPAEVTDRAGDVLAAFFERQGRVVSSRAGAGLGAAALDPDRWDAELADELFAINVLVATAAGRDTLDRLGLDPDEWDEGRALPWLRANAEGVATGVNEATAAQVAAAVEDDEDGSPAAAVAALFAGVVASRATALRDSQVAAVSGFGTTEAVGQAGVQAQKTWRVRSARPRPTHARLDGVSVGMGEVFPNGARWPGDSLASPDERAGCTCDIDVTVEA